MDQLPFEFGNAAGMIRKPSQVLQLAQTELVTHIVIGSFTVHHRAERGGGTDFAVLEDGTASNNRNLPNDGLASLYELGPSMVSIAHEHGKKLVVSGAPFSPEDDALLAKAALEISADLYESNRGCPNTEAKRIISYDYELMADCDNAVDQVIGMQLPWRRKVSPYVDPGDREREAEHMLTCTAAGLVVCNTIARGRLRSKGGTSIINATGTDGYGGISGTALRTLAQINAEHFCELLDANKHVIGVGGIQSGDHLEEYRRIGCAGMQIGAAFFEHESSRWLDRVAAEWAAKYA